MGLKCHTGQFSNLLVSVESGNFYFILFNNEFIIRSCSSSNSILFCYTSTAYYTLYKNSGDCSITIEFNFYKPFDKKNRCPYGYAD
jgi:hypothetical protein